MGAFGKIKWHVQILMMALVCGGALGLVYYTKFVPINEEIDTKTKQRDELQAKVDKSLKLKARYEQFKKEAKALEAKLEELKKVLPQDKEIEQILSQVQLSAKDSGLRIQHGISKAVVDHDAYSEWPMEMQVLGTYHDLGEFLQKIKDLPRIVNVGKLRVENRSGTLPDGKVTSIAATYEATTFVYREISDAVPVAETVKAKK
jgi:type IV pilus assembly protein PilO